jgi:hypothetical protein
MNKKGQMDEMWIAPKRGGGTWTVADYKALDFSREEDWQTAIQMFEDRIRGRFLDIVEKIKSYHYAGFAIMALDCLLIETLEQFRQGVARTPHNQSGQYFVNFLTQTAFSEYFNREIGDLFYRHIRNGLLHQAEITGSSRIRKDEPEMVKVAEDGKGLIINRDLFHERLVEVFEDYLRRLRDGKDQTLRENFRKKMDAICQITAKVK